MKRLVYSPSVNVWIKSDTGVFDLSPYVIDFEIDRRIGEVSVARVSFRNPRVTDERDPTKTRFMFTEHIAEDGSVRPMFHPMDPIIITLTRLKGRPIQVFTGYCDTTPYVQLMPGTAGLNASCTLKRLQYTYWDPALLFVRNFMDSHGWGIDPQSGIAVNPTAERSKQSLHDSSFGSLLYSVLTEVGGWDPKNIYIQELPGSAIVKIVTNLYKENAKESEKSMKELGDYLYSLVGASKYGAAGSGGGGGGGGSFSGSVTLIGDSITVLSKDQIKDKIPGVKIFAQSSKHLYQDGGQEEAIGEGADQKSGLKILEAQKNNLGDAVVIALGTNDVGTPESQFAGWIDDAMEKIGNSKKVVWVNVKNGNDQDINSAISAAATKYNNFTVADWKSKAVLGPDQVHPTTRGQKVFAKAIADALGIQEGGATNAASGQVLGKPIVTKDNFQGNNIDWTFKGKGSQFGSSRKHNYTDPNDNSYGSQPPASGADPDVPGFAARKTIGHTPDFNWFVVVSPNGRAAALPQTDWGPAESVGRAIDVNTAAAIEVFGYTKSGNSINFPTDQGEWKLYFAGKGSAGRTKAENIVNTGQV